MKNYVLKALGAFLIMLVGFSDIQAQLYVYSASSGGVPSYVNPNIYGTNLRRKNGASGASGICPVGFNSKNFSMATSWSPTQPNVSFRLKPQPAVLMTVTSMTADLRISEKGPIYVRAAYTNDAGVTWIDAGFDFNPVIALCGGESMSATWDIPDFTTNKSVLFRLYGYNATGGIGTMQLSNVVINGSLTLTDVDNDGYGVFIDCDDSNADVYPGAVDLCNSIDEDCDGNFDEVDATIEPGGEILLCKHEHVTLSVPDVFESYQWYKNGESIGAAGTSATLNTDKSGYYQVYLQSGLCDGFTAVQAVAVMENPFANIYYTEGLDLCADPGLKLRASFATDYGWQWYKDGVALVDETFYKMNAHDEGDYYCVVSNAYGCTRTTETVTVYNSCRTSEGGGMTENIVLEAYPNPAENMFYVNMQTGTDETVAQLQIFNVTGQQVYAESITITDGSIEQEISLDERFVTGLYLVKVSGNTFESSTQIMINK
ncbi:MAG: T9SS type A sorting domain-containing protein [Fimbriimonadaceae bacterium]|nr:T9SS type A sorting domain-containing protein [Chitinophagales bacterium]